MTIEDKNLSAGAPNNLESELANIRNARSVELEKKREQNKKIVAQAYKEGKGNRELMNLGLTKEEIDQATDELVNESLISSEERERHQKIENLTEELIARIEDRRRDEARLAELEALYDTLPDEEILEEKKEEIHEEHSPVEQKNPFVKTKASLGKQKQYSENIREGKPIRMLQEIRDEFDRIQTEKEATSFWRFRRWLKKEKQLSLLRKEYAAAENRELENESGIEDTK